MTVRAARLTPPGTGAIATVAIVGEQSWEVIRDLFRKPGGQPLSESPTLGSLHFGQFGPPPGDEVVLAARPGTTEPRFEVHSHGGRVLVEWILEQLASRGVSIVPWTELEALRTDSWIRVAAAEALTQAQTAKTAGILLDQFHGVLDQEINQVIQWLATEQIAEGTATLDRLLATASFGLHLTAPFRVAIFGPPNAGKSSLINRLAGYERAVVSALPGTTRELTTTTLAIDGWPITLFDSPGIREAGDALESEGLKRGLQEAADRPFDLVLWLTDASSAVQCPVHIRCDLMVANKSDLVAAPAGLAVSALTGGGIAELEARMIRHLVGPAEPSGGVLFSKTLVEAAVAARAALAEGQLARTQQLLGALVQPEKSQS